MPVLAVPLAAFAPDQAPLAVQLVGLPVEDQVSVALEPVVIEEGLTVKLTVGGVGTTVMLAVLKLSPELFLQVSVKLYVLIVFSEPVLTDPLFALAPVHVPAQSPDAVQLVGSFITDQVSVADAPGLIGPAGLLVSDTSGNS